MQKGKGGKYDAKFVVHFGVFYMPSSLSLTSRRERSVPEGFPNISMNKFSSSLLGPREGRFCFCSLSQAPANGHIYRYCRKVKQSVES